MTSPCMAFTGTPPTLQDFREELLKQDEPEAQEIALAIELFMCDSSTVRPILTHTLPEGKEEVCRVFMLKEQINLVNKKC